MELQSQLSLRSLDVVEGRSSGTGRPSLPTPGDAQGAAGAAHPFAGWLRRGLGETGLGDGAERRVEAQVAGRIRALEPRAERGEAQQGGAVRDGAATRATRPTRGEGRARDVEPEDQPRAERDDPTADPDALPADAATALREPAPRTLDGRGRTITATDAGDARQAEGPAAQGAPVTAAAPHGAGPALAPDPAAVGGTGAGAAPTVTPGLAQGSPAPAAPTPLAAVAPAARAAEARARAAQAAAPPSHGPTAEDIELAEQVMRQLRARIQVGARDAVLELRPRELGRIDVRLRLEDGALRATLRAERPETLAILEAHAPELRAWLAQDGTEVRELDLGLAGDDAAFRPPHHEQGSRQGRSARAGRTDRTEPRVDPADASEARAGRGIDDGTRVDVVI